MKSVAAISILAIGLISATVLSNKWVVDKENVKISWEVRDKTGTFNGLEAEIDFNPASPTDSKIRTIIDVTSQHTGIEDLDSHLQHADFFEAEKYPTIVFESSSVEASASGFITKGMLMVKDTTIAIEIPFTFEQTDAGGLFKGSLQLNTGNLNLTKRSETTEPNCAVTIIVPVVKG